MKGQVIRVDWERHTKPAVRAAQAKKGLVYQRILEILEDEFGLPEEVTYAVYERVMCEMEQRRAGQNVVPLEKKQG